jgi:N-acetylmuramoyl-L-alanine amidase
VTLAIAGAIRDDLATSGRVRVALTRSGDSHLSLQDRYEIARRLGAKLFISLHADAAEREGASGASIYTLSEVASDREAAQLAARENGSGLEGAPALSGDSGVNRILIDLAQREAMTESAAFARLLHREASPLIPFQPDYHRFASLVVLKAPDIPSILFETGYLTNEEDVAFLASAEGRRRIARGLRQAVETHFARRSGATTRNKQAAAMHSRRSLPHQSGA